MIEYQNTKTNSLIRIPENIKIQDVDDYSYLIKRMIHHDNCLIKNRAQKLVNCLTQVKRMKEVQ